MNTERELSDLSDRPAARLPSGFGDSIDQDVLQRQEMIQTILGVYRKYGFQALETPAIEYLDALGKFLPDKDAPDQGVFALRDDDDQWVALRYDLTAPLARVVAQYSAQLPKPYRRYQVGPVWRREKPGPGRFRQFYQCDFDTVGSGSAAVDAEVCAVLAEALETLGIGRGDYIVRVNNRKVLNGVLNTAGVSSELVEGGYYGRPVQRSDPREPNLEWVPPFFRHTKVLQSIDKLDRVGLDGVRSLLGKGRLDESGDFAVGAFLEAEQVERVMGFVGAGHGTRGEVLTRLEELAGADPVGAEGLKELAEIDALLTSMGIEEDRVVFDPTVVRGLDYYTGPVFEAALTFETEEDGERRSFGSVAGGGRYDDLVKRFTGEDVPASGASIGVDRLLAALRSLGKVGAIAEDGPVVVTVMDPERLPEYQAMVSELRAADIASELYLGSKGIAAQLKYADKRRSPVAIIVGKDEFGAGTVLVKDLSKGKEVAATITDRQEWLQADDIQRSVPRSDLVAAVAEILGRRRNDA
jgi:histidyl-tRNA synthetase